MTTTEQVIERARILVAQSTRVSPDIEREDRGDGEERYIVRGVPCGFPVAKFGDHHDAELFVFASTQLIQLLGYRNTPVDSEVERVALAIANRRLPTNCAPLSLSEAKASTGWSAFVADARAAIASLPPKPVDGEVAELVDDVRSIDPDGDGEDYRALIDLALSRKTEPMVTDAMIEAASEAVYNFLDERFPLAALPGGQQLFADTGDHLDAEFKHEAGCEALAKAVLKAVLSAGKKETDDA